MRDVGAAGMEVGSAAECPQSDSCNNALCYRTASQPPST